MDYTVVELSADELEHERVVFGGLAQSVRALAEASLRATVSDTLSLRYDQNTPLGDCSGEAWIDHVEGVKTIVKGELRRADGETTVRAEGIFILPRSAREALEKHHRKPSRFE